MACRLPLPPERANLVLERVVTLYEKALSESPEARTWLAERGIADGALLSRHRVGCSAGTLCSILPSDGRLRRELILLGILGKGGGERFAGCLTFPIIDNEGQVRSLCGVSLKNGSPVQLLPLPPGIWNAAAVRMYTGLYAAATVPEALGLEAAGLENVIALPDRARLSPEDLAIFSEYRTLDIAAANADTWSEALEMIGAATGNACRCRVRVLPPRVSVNDLLKQRGADAVAAWLSAEPVPDSPAVTGPVPAPAACLSLTFGGLRYDILGIDRDHHRLRATVRAFHAGKLHIDTLDLYNARARRAFVRDLALAFDQPHELVDADMFRMISACEQWTPPAAGPGAPDNPSAALTPQQRAVAEAFGKSPRLLDEILEDYAACGLIGEEPNKLLCYLAAVSRKMDTPLCVLLLASSGAGKSAIQAATLAFCPPEDVVRLTSLTGKALFYKDETSLRHRILAVEERTGAEAADYAIRSLISAGELAVESVVREGGTGALRAVSHRVCGPTAVFFTVTDPRVDPETRSRFFVIGVDESCRQTAQILATQRARQTFDGLADELRIEAIREKHRCFQRLLRPLTVVNPFAADLNYGDDRLQARRDQPRYLNLIRAVAFLRQMSKEVRQCCRAGTTVEYIAVEPADIEIAGRLAAEILGTSLDELSAPARDLLVLLEKMVALRQAEAAGDGESPLPAPLTVTFTRREVREHTGWTRTRLQVHLSELLDMEYVVMATRSRQGLQHYQLLYCGQGRDGKRFVPGLKGMEALGPQAGGPDTGTGPVAVTTGHPPVRGESARGQASKNDITSVC